MNRLIIILLLLVCGNTGRISAQPGDSLSVDLFSLYENASDQEGMFYLPPVRRVGPFSGSRPVMSQRLEAATRQKNYSMMANAAINLAWIELEQEHPDKAVAYFDIAAEARRQLHDERGEAFIFLQKGFTHYRSLQYEEAIQAYRQAETQLKNTGSPRAVAVSHAMLAQTYLMMKDFALAEKYFLLAHSEFASLGAENATARISVQLAELAIRKNNPDEARKYLNEANKYFVGAGDAPGQAMVYRDFGIMRFKTGDYEGAIDEYLKSLALSGQLSVAKLLKDTYLKIFTIKSLAGSHEESNRYNILYVQLRDSIDREEQSRVVSSQLLRRELVEREAVQEMIRKDGGKSYQGLPASEIERNLKLTAAEIERLEKEKIIEDLDMARRISDQANVEREEKIQQLTRDRALQEQALSKVELQMNKAQTVRNTLLIAVLSAIIIAILLYTRYRNQRKSHAELDTAYKELSDTHHKLIAAQEQLVHSQKMASLGQLTAGIAHEIQNPLNFVNNFSELSIELIEELRQPGANSNEILNDLTSNLEKIHNHGMRADKIVKGMLLHSRAGQADKHPSDLNKMIDELLELSYHGNRTRDNSFRAEIIRNLDPSLPQVNMVTQDISRVLINLFNNSFYAVGQRAHRDGGVYKATVGVSTKSDQKDVIIRIRDNGTGIPEEVRKKIFDPFFTTKPAGEGTGLGLSLSYDIVVKGHNGTMKVASEPNAFTEFIITLPLN